MMEQKHVLLSALSIGVGVGVGLGLASGSTLGKWTGGAGYAAADGVSAEQLALEILRLVVDGKESKVTFEDFPYYLSERTRDLLTSAAYVHLKHLDVSKHTRNLSPASRAILLSGPIELYHQMLAKALAHHFEAKLLVLDINDFSLKIQSKYAVIKKDSSLKKSISEATLERMSSLFGSFSMLPYKDGNRAPPKRISSWSFDEKDLLHTVYKVLVSISQTNCVILYIRDVDKLFLQSSRLYKLFDGMLKKLTGSVVVLGSRMLDFDKDCVEVDEGLSLLFPYNIEIRPPKDETHLVNWKSQLEEDIKKIQIQDNRNHIAEVLAANDFECDDLGSICYGDTVVLSNYIEEIVVSALSYHLMNNKGPEYRNGKLVISANSLSHGLLIFQESKNGGRDSEVPPDNEFEKRIRSEVIPANKIGVSFSDIGSPDETKESLQELVMLPLRRPDLFTGGLLKPCRGILLFGPPGTGKTMLAKAIANEAGASFINVSMSTITSSLFGEAEKNVRALFTLAAKVSPTIIFLDEVDSMLGQRSTGEHEVMNEFMTHWDGLLTRSGERIFVLAATTRPFDLDEAIIRRFERRIMVDLPSAENKEKILKTLLSKEKVENIDFKELATMTEGYTGSDLKNLCVTAAYRPVREFIQQEREKNKKKKQKDEEGKSSVDASATVEETKEEKVISLRPLNMEDMKQAKNQVAVSFASEGSVMAELKQWNELYGEGGSRKKQQLSYFL